MTKTFLLSLGLLGLAACAAAPASETADVAAPATPEAADVASLDELGADVRRSKSYKESWTEEDGDRIICKTREATGSRVRKNKVCGTKEQFRMADDANDRAFEELTGNRAASNSQ